MYRRVIDSFVTYNLSVGYEFDNTASALLRDSKLRLSIVNLTDNQPPLATDAFGYDPSVSQSLLSGRSFSVEFTRKF